eukprot:TRINITY_DN2049_c0_g1_i1.p1 TRINITY_DN2049_c0_g1~~TRINITY_DN2049_c0_g1_i1.p1  ORF type:complete len:156 (-),score=59.73 TRINITY_DN2049_c0_g1_i1:549-1016(-)
MDAIKGKMVKLAGETETATARANKFEEEGEGYKKDADKIEQQLANITKKFQSMESQYDVVIEDLFNATIKLEEKEKVAANAEADVGSSSRRILLMEDDADKSENRLATAISGCSELLCELMSKLKQEHSCFRTSPQMRRTLMNLRINSRMQKQFC